MKKYIIIISTLIFGFLLYNFLCFNLGLYIPFDSEEIKTTFITEDKTIKHNNEIFKIKGVNIGSSAPGYYTTDYKISKKTYSKWLKQIKEMGANCVRVQTIINDEFYNALYEFNKNNDEPLYLLQGIVIETYNLDNKDDAYNKQYYNSLTHNAKLAVDVVHGKRKILDNSSDYSSGNYTKDVSKWTIGYIVNIEMNTKTVIYTDDRNEDKKEFNGKYIKTNKDATPYEAMLARVLDSLVTYETNKYGEQKLLTFENVPLTDPFDYPEDIKYHYKKATKIDINHLDVTENLKSGLVASYQAFSYFIDYSDVFKNEEYKNKDIYYEYLKQLNEYHKYPVLITSFGFSTNRGRIGNTTSKYYNASVLTEEEQGKAILKSYETIMKAGSMGAFIDEWSDNSNKSSYNTLKRVDLSRLPWWFDVQSSSAGKGLLKFESGKKETVARLDSYLNEYKEEDKIKRSDDLDLYMKYDFKYLYFGIKRNDKNNHNPTVILLDTTQKSGSKNIKRYNIKADRPVDFAIYIHKPYDSRIVVHERYNTFKPIDYYETYNRNPYEHIPDKNSNEFKNIYMMERAFYKDLEGNKYDPILFETGKLRYGSTDKENKQYDTQADYYKENNIIEVRIPWELLNFSDPSKMKIHDDYYKHYGVENIPILNMYVDATRDEKAELTKVQLKDVNNKIYHEELKDSYYIVKEGWNK